MRSGCDEARFWIDPVEVAANHGFNARELSEIGGGGVALHWPDLDEDLSIAGLMAGDDVRSG